MVTRHENKTFTGISSTSMHEFLVIRNKLTMHGLSDKYTTKKGINVLGIAENDNDGTNCDMLRLIV